MGVELVDVTIDRIRLDMPVEERHVNFLGVCHGASTFALADVAFSLASNSAGPRAVAVDTHLALTGGARLGDRLTAVATEATRGRTLGTYRVEVSRSDGRVVGLFTGTVHIAPEDSDA
jgi:acyl-CoA thioesterase